MKKPLVSVIIPTYNESKTIVKMIRDIKKLRKKMSLEIIVADGGSVDGTAKLAKKEQVRVISYPKKRGKGADFWAAAQQAKGNYIVQIDGDYQFKPNEISLLTTALDRGADVAIAHRIDQGDAPIIRTLGNFLLTFTTSLLVGRRIYDTLAGFKAIKTPVLLSLQLTEPHFGYEAETVIKSIRMGYKLVEIPVSYSRRNTGASQVNALKDGWLILQSIFKARFIQLPKKYKSQN